MKLIIFLFFFVIFLIIKGIISFAKSTIEIAKSAHNAVYNKPNKSQKLLNIDEDVLKTTISLEKIHEETIEKIYQIFLLATAEFIHRTVDKTKTVKEILSHVEGACIFFELYCFYIGMVYTGLHNIIGEKSYSYLLCASSIISKRIMDISKKEVSIPEADMIKKIYSRVKDISETLTILHEEGWDENIISENMYRCLNSCIEADVNLYNEMKDIPNNVEIKKNPIRYVEKNTYSTLMNLLNTNLQNDIERTVQIL